MLTTTASGAWISMAEPGSAGWSNHSFISPVKSMGRLGARLANATGLSPLWGNGI